MQLNSTYLYPNVVDVFLNLSATWQAERYRNVYNRNVKIYRGGDNRIDIQMKNSDQKAIPITAGYVPVFVLVNAEQEQVFKTDITVDNATTGKAHVTLSSAVLRDIAVGSYQYSIILEARTGTIVTERKPTYIDSQYGAYATIEIYGDLYGEPVNSIEVTKFNKESPASTGYPGAFFYVSSLINANYDSTFSYSYHTFSIHCTSYSGEIIVQASLDDSATPANWTDVATLYPSNQSDTMYVNVEGKWRWFRIKHTPGQASYIADFTVAQTLLNVYQVSVRTAGLGYQVGDIITILGSDLGGEAPGQNLVITVDSVGVNGQIQTVSWTGNSYSGVRTFVVSGTISNTGSLDKILYR
jgi:hypothetical protein